MKLSTLFVLFVRSFPTLEHSERIFDFELKQFFPTSMLIIMIMMMKETGKRCGRVAVETGNPFNLIYEALKKALTTRMIELEAHEEAT